MFCRLRLIIGEGKMRKFKHWRIVAVMLLLVGLALWWFASEIKERQVLLNQFDAFVYDDNDVLSWFELTSLNGKVKGEYHQQKIKEKETFSVTGKETEEGFELKVDKHGDVLIFDIKPSKSNLLVQKRGEKSSHLYRGVSREELATSVEANREYNTEYDEKIRWKQFTVALKRNYGYLYAEKNGTYQLFLKVDEVLFGGELSGSLFVMNANGDSHKPYKETRYVMNGITDGNMVEFFPTVNGKSTKLGGHFLKDATGLDLLFWITGEQLRFHAVTEKEFKQSYEKFKLLKE